MCGISCFLSTKNNNESVINTVQQHLQRRGPDYFNESTFQINKYWTGSFFASVLHTQGSSLTQQPVLSPLHILLWNGDVFEGEILQYCSGNESDTTIIANWLEKNDGDVLKLVTKLEGPYSFIYYDYARNLLWISRDVLGRHSLLWKITENSIFVSSVGHKSLDDLEEVPAAGLFCFKLSQSYLTSVSLHPWSHYQSTSINLFSLDLIISETVINYFNFKLKWNEYEKFFIDIAAEDSLTVMRLLLQNEEIDQHVTKLSSLLQNSVRKRVLVQRNICKNCISRECSPDHVKIGILFSGGLDSTIVAVLADKFIPKGEPIDLFNVAFLKNGNYNVPDRVTGISSFNELQQLCPSRDWNFVEINIGSEELVDKRKNHICHLIHPLKTVLDESLGCALWFACRGEGTIHNKLYKSSAKIILLGTGADEQLGGYTRHRNLLKRSGWTQLGEQLIKETIEISKRNLGRDDRIACDHGRQPRFPFLDESVVKFVAELAPWQKCEPNLLPQGLGDKLLLRLVAVKLGLNQCSTFPKKAFQFGCRIANSKEKGDNFSDRL